MLAPCMVSCVMLQTSCATAPPGDRAAGDRADGVYAAIYTTKGKIVGRLEPELTPLAVANFVGLAEGTIENAAFPLGRPFYDGTVYHRVVPGHVIQTGVPKDGKANGPGYTFPNEIHAKLSHNHAGAFNFANGGPNTNAAQFCITLGDRSYLDYDYIVFGDVVEGMDVVKAIVQGDAIDSVRITRIGSKAQSYRPNTQSFREMLRIAQARDAAHAARKPVEEEGWIVRNVRNLPGAPESVRSVQTQPGAAQSSAGPMRVRYSGTELRYLGHILGRNGPPIEAEKFVSGDDGRPGPFEAPRIFAFAPGQVRINPGLDGVIANMKPGERRTVVVPAALGYARGGLYRSDIPGVTMFVISPNSLLVYDVEVLPN
jgi:cyclophilin family peptidyl-prolyl cis-trans isomerase